MGQGFLTPLPTDAGGLMRRRSENTFLEGGKTVSGIVSTIAVITKAVPGVPGKIIGVVAAGLEKDVGTGRVGPGAGTLSNFAPSPFGFMRTDAYDLPRDYWLPKGVTEITPGVIDRLELGFPEARQKDEADETSRVVQQRRKIAGLLANETDATLEAFLENDFTNRRANELALYGPQSTGDVRIAARQVLNAREAAGVRVVAISPITLAQLVASGSLNPHAIDPPAETARRNRLRKRGIDKELATEVADP